MESHTTGAELDLERERQRLIDELLAAEGLDAPVDSGLTRRDPAEPVPVTYAQEVLWLLDRATPGLTAYNTPLARRLRGPLDVTAFDRALQALGARHESLRTVFAAHGDGAVQKVLADCPVTLAVHDMSGLPLAEREGAALAALRAAADVPFDLARDPGFRCVLARIADDDHVLLLLTHHIVSDAWSYGVIFRELGELYEAELRGGRPDLPPPALQYGDFAAWQRATLVGETLETGLGYWRARLADLPVLELPTEFVRPAVQGFAGARRTTLLSPALHAAVRALAQRTGTSVYTVLVAAYASVLRRYAGQDDIVIGSAVANRVRREIEDIVGYFSQALPMRVRFDGDPIVTELLARVSETVLSAFEHQDTPLESLVLELQRGRAQSHAPLFRVVLTMQDTMGAELRLRGVEASPLELDAGATKFDLTMLATERPDGLELTLWHRTDLFSATYADRFLGHMTSVLEAIVASPGLRVSELPMLTAAERASLATWNDTTVDEGPAATLTALFEAQAARVGERAAVVSQRAGGSASGDALVLTYAELDARANQVAHRLRAGGVTANVPVGLLLDRSTDAIVGLLGILKAGGAYVPLSVDAPSARLAQQLAECGARNVVTSSAFAARLPISVSMLTLDADALGGQPDTPLPATASPQDLAYVLFTSGSTGTAKGVAVTHANAVHYARAVSRVLADVPARQAGDGFTALDGLHFGMVSTLAADLGNTSLLPALLSGGTLYVLSTEVATEPARFAEYTAAHPLDVLKATPAHMLALAAGRSGAELARVLPRRWLVVGGEALRPEAARAFLAAGNCRVLNHYGPTETTVGVCTLEVTRATLERAASAGAQTVPIGRPLANTRAYVVDASGLEQPVGVPGELLIGGAGVAQGYLGRADLSAERFVVFHGERVYRTGDRVRRHEDGTLEFLGRADDQVKVRGYRVELGEIESALRSHPGVAQAVVVAHADAGTGTASLAAYVVPKQGGYAASHTDRATPAGLGAWLAATLPEYMVPGAVVLLDELPLTANGKVDRSRLQPPTAADAGEPEAPTAPSTPTEEAMARIWCEVLKRETLGVNENFLALGGHSLLAIRVLGKVSKTFGVRLSLRALFDAPTVAQLAAAVDRAVAGQG